MENGNSRSLRCQEELVSQWRKKVSQWLKIVRKWRKRVSQKRKRANQRRKRASQRRKRVERKLEWCIDMNGRNLHSWKFGSPKYRFEGVEYKIEIRKLDPLHQPKFLLLRKGPSFYYNPSRYIRWTVSIKTAALREPMKVNEGFDFPGKRQKTYKLVRGRTFEPTFIEPSSGQITFILKLRGYRLSTRLESGLTGHTSQGLGTFSQNTEDYHPGGRACDVTVNVRGTSFRVHRVILESRSPVLAAMFFHDMAESNTGVISIDDIEAEEFQVLITFLYYGKVENLTSQNVIGTYYAADKYGLSELRRYCMLFIESHLSVSSVLDVISLAVRHSDKRLLNSATEFFAKNFIDILHTHRWKKFARENPNEAAEIYNEILEKL